MNSVRLKVIDSNHQEVSLGFSLIEIPRVGDIVQNANKLQFEVEAVLHRKHDNYNVHVIEIHLGESL